MEFLNYGKKLNNFIEKKSLEIIDSDKFYSETYKEIFDKNIEIIED